MSISYANLFFKLILIFVLDMDGLGSCMEVAPSSHSGTMEYRKWNSLMKSMYSNLLSYLPDMIIFVFSTPISPCCLCWYHYNCDDVDCIVPAAVFTGFVHQFCSTWTLGCCGQWDFHYFNCCAHTSVLGSLTILVDIHRLYFWLLLVYTHLLSPQVMFTGCITSSLIVVLDRALHS